MSEFRVPVVRITIEPHPNADAIEIARVGDFQSIVKKGQFKDGDLAAYLPEAALLPEGVLRALDMWDHANNRGKLHGAAGNRVKAIKLRGVLSQGIIYPLERRNYHPDVPERELDGWSVEIMDGCGSEADVDEGDDVAEHLRVTKYEPTVPAHMAGKAIGANLDITHKYDFDNIKAHPHLFVDGEDVVMTEKIHGTLVQIICVPESMANEKFYKRRVCITSKGLGGRGIILDHTDETNVYAQAVTKHRLLDKWLRACELTQGDEPMLFGEVYGAGIQDLGYDSKLEFRAFDMCVGVRDKAEFADYDTFEETAKFHGIPTVPIFYRGPFFPAVVKRFTDGDTTLGGGSHIREGIVVKSAVEARHPRYGRKIAKSVSEAYLLRKNATEFN
jgi:RNA ligase (TIGR02306 family)